MVFGGVSPDLEVRLSSFNWSGVYARGIKITFLGSDWKLLKFIVNLAE